MMKNLAAAAILAAAFAFPAHAQEPPIWTGAYIGAHGGYAWGDAKTSDDIKDWCTPGDAACIKKYVGPFDWSPDGAFGGGTAGLNWQHGILVVGLEADLGYMDISGSRKTDSSNPAKYQTLDVEGGLYAVGAGRLGLALGRALLYGKGGWAYLDTDITQTTTNPGYVTTGTGSLTGTVYGGGVEWALRQGWSLKAEYLHFDFDEAGGNQTSIADKPIGYVYKNVNDLDLDTFKVGLNYRFNGGSEGILPLK